MIEPNFRQPVFNSNKILSKSILILTILFVTISLFSIVADFFQFSLIADLKEGLHKELIDSNDSRQGVIAILNLFILIPLMVVFYTWVNRSNKNLSALGVKNKIFSSGWSVGWFFIPVMSIYKPCQVMKEIWNESTRVKIKIDNYDYTKKAPSGTVVLWWIVWVIDTYFSSFVLRYSIMIRTLDSLYNLTIMYVISSTLNIVNFIFTAYLVHKITNYQIEKYKILKAQEQSIPDNFETDNSRNFPNNIPPTYTPFS
ncbi:MAG TPA: DUF4328 domain-containing protein [Clostridia bacterium]